MPRTEKRLIALLTLVLLLAALRLASVPLLMDERLHERQVQTFLRGESGVISRLEMLPTYHLFLAGAARLCRASGPGVLRLATLALSLWALAGFFIAARAYDRDRAAEKLFVAATLPALFPFLFLVYSDLFALGAIAWAVASALRRAPRLAAFYAVLAVLIRQNHIFWLVFVWALAAWAPLREREGLDARAILREARKAWSFPCALLAYLACVLAFGGVSLHPPVERTLRPELGNVFFLLFLSSLLFLPRAWLIVETITRRLSPLLLVTTIIGAWFLFSAPHPYNFFRGHLRNYLFLAVAGDAPARLGFSLLCGAGALMLRSFDVERFVGIALALATAGSLVPLELVEQRYLYPTLWLLVLFDRNAARASGMQRWWGLLLSLLMLEGIARGSWFP